MNHLSAHIATMRRAAALAAAAIFLVTVAACSRSDQPAPTAVPVVSNASSGPEQGGQPAAGSGGPEGSPLGAGADDPAPTLAPTETPTQTPPSGTVTVWHSWAQRDGDALDAILQGFRERFPTIRVETLFVAQNDLLQSYAQAVADGSGPDVVLAPNWWLYELKTLGVVSPLDDSLFADAVSGAWPAAVDNLRIDGQLFGMPTSYETVALYYNKALIQEDALPQSLDELFQIAQRSPQQGIGIYANPFHVAWGFPAFGAELFDESGHAILDQSAGTAQFLQWLADLDALDGSYVDSDYGMLIDRFKRGEYAFFVDGPWSLPELSETLGDDLGVTVIPAGPGGAARPWLYADAAYLSPNLSSEQVALAALFVEHLTGSQSGGTIAQIAGRLPANQAADLAGDPLLTGFAAQAATADAMPHGPEMDAFWRYGGDMILKTLTGAEDLPSIVADTAALTNDASGK